MGFGTRSSLNAPNPTQGVLPGAPTTTPRFPGHLLNPHIEDAASVLTGPPSAMPSSDPLSTRVLASTQSFHLTAKPRSSKAESNSTSLEKSRLLLSFLQSLSFFLCEIRRSLLVDSVVKNLLAM